MSETQKTKSKWSIIQSSLSVLTPVLIGVVGFFFQSKQSDIAQNQKGIELQISSIQSQISNVEAMEPFMKMISSEDRTLSIMGAYAIYMLKKETDPGIAAEMILAPQKLHLIDVLQDIGANDTIFESVVSRFSENVLNITSNELKFIDDETNTDSLQLTDRQRYALKVVNKINQAKSVKIDLGKGKAENKETIDKKASTPLNESKTTKPVGWLYLGNINERLLIDRIPTISNIKTSTFNLLIDANLRINKPQPPNYKLPRFVRVVNKGDAIKIDTFTVDKKGHYWARVIFQ